MKAHSFIASVGLGLVFLVGYGSGSRDENGFENVSAKEGGKAPFLALDCRNPPNTLACDRVWLEVRTGKKKRQVKVDINQWSAKTAAGWVHAFPETSKLSKLSSPKSAEGSPPWSQKRWVGTIRRAGIQSLQVPLKGKLPEGEERWVGNNPRIRADVVVRSRDLSGSAKDMIYRNVPLIAGHG